MRTWTALLPLALLLSSCARTPEKSAAPEKRFSIHGEVLRLDPQAKIATIKHDKIQGWMEAMTMGYPVKDQKDFDALKVDQCIDATVVVQGDNFWLSDVQNQKNTPPDQCVPPPGK